MINSLKLHRITFYIMAAHKFKSNIIDLVCRTCLKMEKVKFNMYKHFHNEKFISDILMECTSVKVQKDDCFPINICQNCLEKLKLAYEFKTMVLQSDTKLHNFYRSKAKQTGKDLQNDDALNFFIKEEAAVVKSEQIDALSDLTDNSNNLNYKNIATGNLIGKEDIIIDNIEKNKLKVSAIEQDVEQCSKQSNNSIVIKDCCKGEENQKNDVKAEGTRTKKKPAVKHDDYNTSDDENLMDNSTLPQNESTDETSSDDSSTSSDHVSDDSDNENEKKKKVKQVSKPAKQKKKRGNVDNHNEKHAELLGNPDYQRIMKMGLSRKEKDKTKVFCEECGKMIKFRYYVSVHAYMHAGSKFKCNKCDKSFPRKNILTQHMRIHSETKDYSCDICGKSFTTFYSSEIHKAKHSDERNFKCDVCGKTFKYDNTLKKHLLRHKNDRKFVCELCGKSFIEKVGLTRHKVTHSTERNFKCTICEKGFASKIALDEHSKRHSDLKPYICSYCGNRFKSNNVLKNHILIHTGAKPFACELCDKRFRQRTCLRNHMRIHTGESPFECKLCPSKFKYKHHLSNHMKIHDKQISQKQDDGIACVSSTT